MHHLADVAQPLGSSRLELTIDEVAHVHTRRRLAPRAVAEVEAAAREDDLIPAPALPRKDEGSSARALDDDRRRRTAVPGDRFHREGLELGLSVSGQLLVDQLLVQPGDAVQDDHATSGIRHRCDVSHELDVVHGLTDRNPLRAPLGCHGSAQQSVRLRHALRI
jgi:hypothetical protein